MKENLTIEYNSDIYISTTFNCYLLDGPFLYLTGQDRMSQKRSFDYERKENHVTDNG